MTYTEIKERGNKKYYYRAKSIRKGKKIKKQRIYLGVNLSKQNLGELEKKADEKLLNKKTEKQIKEKHKETKKQLQESKEQESQLGITAEKDEFSDWFVQLLQKSELIEYTKVSGSYVIRPKAYFIWEKVKDYFDKKIKQDGVKNAYFPLLIPESNLIKEKEHVQGFSPEVAWVTHAGDTKLSEKLAIRPTSETIMYPSYAKWIRSWRDLPLRLNQWVNVLRWEFKNPVPFIRSREFLWQEGHTAFATKNQAEQEAEKILDFYADVYKEMYAIPVIKGVKTEKEKFAGADRTLTTEIFLPSGKAVQGATSHNLGQNFSKVFNIKFLDKDKKEKFVWQNSWGISTRSIGIAVMTHSDNKGLVISPKISDIQAIIIPIFKTQEEKKQIIKKCQEIKNKLNDFRIEIDDREEYTPGFKFNEWELKGIPIRLELGPKDLEKNQVVMVDRLDNKKRSVKISKIKQEIKKEIERQQSELYKRAEKFLQDNICKVENMTDLKSKIKERKIVLVPMCKKVKCEDWVKGKSGGAKTLNIPFEQPDLKGKKCVNCGKQADYWVYVGKSY